MLGISMRLCEKLQSSYKWGRIFNEFSAFNQFRESEKSLEYESSLI